LAKPGHYTQNPPAGILSEIEMFQQSTISPHGST
jgi:hypothetical protein